MKFSAMRLIMDGVVVPFPRGAFTAEALLNLTLLTFGVVTVGVFVVMWFRGEL